MLDRFFESRERSRRDAREITMLRERYGIDLINKLQERVRDRSLASRDRRHWRRILRKASRAA